MTCAHTLPHTYHERFDPQALTSLTSSLLVTKNDTNCFDPQALTSLTELQDLQQQMFQSFDPQALTSLT